MSVSTLIEEAMKETNLKKKDKSQAGVWLFMLQSQDMARLKALGIEGEQALQAFVTIAIRSTLAEMEGAKREGKRKKGGKPKCEN